MPWTAPDAGFSYKGVEDDGTCQPDETSPDDNGQTTIYFPPHPRVEARYELPSGAAFSGAGWARNEPAPALPTDALGNVLTWPAMQQPVNPGDWITGQPATGYDFLLDPGQRYANELASGSGCRFANYYYALTLGNGR